VEQPQYKEIQIPCWVEVVHRSQGLDKEGAREECEEEMEDTSDLMHKVTHAKAADEERTRRATSSRMHNDAEVIHPKAEEVDEAKDRARKAAVLLQGWWRSCVKERQVQRDFAVKKKAAVTVQAWWRGVAKGRRRKESLRRLAEGDSLSHLREDSDVVVEEPRLNLREDLEVGSGKAGRKRPVITTQRCTIPKKKSKVETGKVSVGRPRKQSNFVDNQCPYCKGKIMRTHASQIRHMNYQHSDKVTDCHVEGCDWTGTNRQYQEHCRLHQKSQCPNCKGMFSRRRYKAHAARCVNAKA